ncbi:MAG: thrombospondin type 3 repeat-containing protein, partial [Nanoarchaeota archaeon]
MQAKKILALTCIFLFLLAPCAFAEQVSYIDAGMLEGIEPQLLEDTDLDQVPDTTDNCLFTPNYPQEDSNNNGIGDACDAPTEETCSAQPFFLLYPEEEQSIYCELSPAGHLHAAVRILEQNPSPENEEIIQLIKQSTLFIENQEAYFVISDPWVLNLNANGHGQYFTPQQQALQLSLQSNVEVTNHLVQASRLFSQPILKSLIYLQEFEPAEPEPSELEQADGDPTTPYPHSLELIEDIEFQGQDTSPTITSFELADPQTQEEFNYLIAQSLEKGELADSFLETNPQEAFNNYQESFSHLTDAIDNKLLAPHTQTIGPDGGIITSMDKTFQIEVPANALSEETTITVFSLKHEDVAWDFSSYTPRPMSAVYSLSEPLEFSSPVLIKITVDEKKAVWGDDEPKLYLFNPDNGEISQLIETNIANHAAHSFV